MQRELRVELSEEKIGKAFLVALIPALPMPVELTGNEFVTGCAVIAANDENENGIYSYVHLESDEKEFIGDALANACVPMNTWVWCQLFDNNISPIPRESLDELREENKKLTDILVRIRDHELYCGCSPGSFIYGCKSCRIKREIITPALTD